MKQEETIKPLTLDSINPKKWEGKKVLVRVDFNVPFDENGEIANDTRIRESIPTIKELINNGAKVILVAHRGKGKKEETLKPVAQRLTELLQGESDFKGNPNVIFAEQLISEDPEKKSDAEEKADALQNGQVMLLENIRHYKEETSKDKGVVLDFAKKIKSILKPDYFVNDAFGAAHRYHASTAGLAKILIPFEGRLMQKEHEGLKPVLEENPERPYVAVLGGSKVSSKIGAIKTLMGRADKILIGGQMANIFLVAQGHDLGWTDKQKSKLKPEIEYAKDCLNNENSFKIVLPLDLKIAHLEESDAEPAHNISAAGQDKLKLAEGTIVGDIGEETIKTFKEELSAAQTVFWNGPLGWYEKEAEVDGEKIHKFREGSFAIAKHLPCLTNKGVKTVVGGGETLDVIEKAGIPAKGISHISTGGGSSIEATEKGWENLPAIAQMIESWEQVEQHNNNKKTQPNPTAPGEDDEPSL